MNILLWIILGALAGYLASLIMGGGRSWLANVIIGVLGAGIGGFVASLLGLGGVTGFNLYSLLVAVAGACLLLGLFNLLKKTL
ncbi:MAG: GlsB/YeaQ/YmgE family stress response membrane protein [Clostridiales bacterium]|nr:GlsB/YeaQ/YmgE family stress response membrane protein [Clostridiales bacterium]